MAKKQAKRKKKEAQPRLDKPNQVRFHYLKSPHYRTVLAEGVIGGPTPHGRIQMTVFSEHLAIPQQTVSKLKSDGTLGEELKQERVSREGVVRDLETTLIFNEEVGDQLIEWLQRNLKELRKAKKAQKLR